MKNIAVLASGTGTNLAAMIDQGVHLSLVLADKQCLALEIAEQAGIPTVVIDRRAKFGYRQGIGEGWDRQGFTAEVTATLKQYHIDVVAMAGFFTILHDDIFRDFPGHILNIHPALLPKFPGEFAVRDALESGEPQTGTTVHIATVVLDDHRYILAQKTVPIEPGDDVTTLWERIKVEERQLYPQVLLDILSGKIDLDEVKKQPYWLHLRKG
jgi:phosphoribosylglycinamide formyltransferase-1